MAWMLRKHTGHMYGCCGHCARKSKFNNKPQKKERRVARARDKRAWQKETRSVSR